MRADLGIGRPQGLGDMQPGDFRGSPRHHLRQAAVGIGVAPRGIHAGDMGGHHLGGEAGACFHLGQLASRLFQCGIGGRELTVAGGQRLGAADHLFRQEFRAGAQQRLLRLHGGDVGINRDPAALRQRPPLDRDGPAVRARALHVVRGKGAGLLDPRPDEILGIVHRAILTRAHEVADGVLEAGAGPSEPLGQVEHLREGAVADSQLQLAIIDRERLLDQVQPCLCERVLVHEISSNPRASTPPPPREARRDVAGCAAASPRQIYRWGSEKGRREQPTSQLRGALQFVRFGQRSRKH